MRGGRATLQELFNTSKPTNIHKHGIINQFAEMEIESDRPILDELKQAYGDKESTKELFIKIRKAIIEQFPKYVTTDGVINYKGILHVILNYIIAQDHRIFDTYYLSAREEGAVNKRNGFEKPTLYLINSKLPIDDDRRSVRLLIDGNSYYNNHPSLDYRTVKNLMKAPLEVT
jgi:hypothetical protein